ncbi:MAG: BspA family leucine-rich repeat surface protein, partial [Bacteroidota bacterium]
MKTKAPLHICLSSAFQQEGKPQEITPDTDSSIGFTRGIKTILLLVFCLFSATLSAQTWTGSEDSNWDNPGNWSNGEVPHLSSVYIGPSANEPILENSEVYINSLLVADGATMTISDGGVLNISRTNPFYLEGNITIGLNARLTNNGVINIEGNNSSSNLETYFGIYIYQGATFINENLGNLANSGIINIEGIVRTDDINGGHAIYGLDATILNYDNSEINIENAQGEAGIYTRYNTTITNWGSINIEDTNDGIILIDNPVFTNNGTIDIENALNNGIRLTTDDGVSTNNGTIVIKNVTDDGLRVSGNEFTNNGTIDIQEADFGINIEDDTPQFINDGLIDIDACKIYAILISQNNTDFINNTTGRININQRLGQHSQVGMLVFGLFTNKGGQIRIDHFNPAGPNGGDTFRGIDVSGDGRFTNEDGGLIFIGALTPDSLGNHEVSAIITLGNAEFFNSPCSGVVNRSSYKIRVHATGGNTIITNNGWIINHSQAMSFISGNAGTILNFGNTVNVLTGPNIPANNDPADISTDVACLGQSIQFTQDNAIWGCNEEFTYRRLDTNQANTTGIFHGLEANRSYDFELSYNGVVVDTYTHTVGDIGTDDEPPALECTVTEYVFDLGDDPSLTIDVSDLTTASDNCGIASLEIQGHGETRTFGCGDFGENTITVEATDLIGNTSICEITVEITGVYPELTPGIPTTNDLEILLDGNGEATLGVGDLDISVDLSTPCFTQSEAEAYYNIPASFRNLDCGDVGTHTFSLTRSDGNFPAISQTITVVDATPILASVADVTVNLNASGVGSLGMADLVFTVSDNCYSDAEIIAAYSVPAGSSSFDCSDIGSVFVALDKSNSEFPDVTVEVTVVNGVLSLSPVTTDFCFNEPFDITDLEDQITTASGTFTYSKNIERLYVPNFQDHTVSVVDLNSKEEIQTIPVGTNPWGVNVSPDNQRVYVTNITSGTVSVIEVATNTVVQTIAVGNYPIGTAFNSDGSQLYVTNALDDNVSVIDTSTDAVTGTIDVGNIPWGIALSPDDTKAYVAHEVDNNVRVVEIATGITLETIDLGQQFQTKEVGISADGSKVYVGSGWNQNNPPNGVLSIIDTGTNTVAETLSLDYVSPNGLSVHPNGDVYAVYGDEGSGVLSRTNSSNVTSYSLIEDGVANGLRGLSFNADGTMLYIIDNANDKVIAYDPQTGTETTTIAVGDGPLGMGRCYVKTTILITGPTSYLPSEGEVINVGFDGGGECEAMTTITFGDDNCDDFLFITKWQTTAADQTITLPITLGGSALEIDWGDGSGKEIVTTDHPAHSYATARNDYRIEVKGIIDAIAFNGTGDRLNILEVVQWGSTPWSTMANAFAGCENLDVTATDTPDLSGATSLDYMFADCTNLVGTATFNSWDVSSISSMEGVFFAASVFNQPLNGWDVSNVTNLKDMFNEAHAFNQPLDDWDVSDVTNMRSVFKNALAFDQDLGSWDIGSADNMFDFLRGTSLSLENYDNTIIGFATLNAGEAQLPSIQNFDGGSNQVCFAVAERGILIGLTVGNYSDGGVSVQCSGDAFITQWELEGDALEFTLPIANGDYYYEVDWGDGAPVESRIKGAATHDYGTTDGIGGTKTIAIRGVFPRIIFGLAPEQDRLKLTRVTQWGDIQWSSMKDAFLGCENLDVTATDVPDLSNVTDMEVMFRGCSSLIGTTAFNTWDVSNVTSMFRTFDEAHVFNQPLNDWEVSNVTNMERMFSGANAFNQPLNDWDVSNVTNMERMFSGANAFNQPLNDWNVLNVIDMSYMFEQAHMFDQDISNWDVDNVTNMVSLFKNAESFNQDISSWDISALISAAGMFDGVALSTANYDALLMGWGTLDTVAGETQVPSGVEFSGGDSQYCNALEARNMLLTAHGWEISDGGPESASCTEDTAPFITKWDVGAENPVVLIGHDPLLNYNYFIDWGDGTSIEASTTGAMQHSYGAAGIYEVKIYGDFPRMVMGLTSLENRERLIEVSQWGDIVWQGMADAFFGCTNLEVTATDAPDLSVVASLSGMFKNCTNLQGTATFNTWGTSKVSDMSEMFSGATSFDQNLGDWDLSSLTDAADMFNSATLSTANCDALLTGWSTLDTSAGETQVPSDIEFSGGNSQYCAAVDERDVLLGLNWSITDGGPEDVSCLGISGIPFITTWQVGDGETITIPTQGGGYDYAVVWGDSGNDAETGLTGDALHQYTVAGTYEVRIYGDFPRIYFNNGGNRENILSVSQWGDIQWGSMEAAFFGCENLDVTATDVPDLSNLDSDASLSLMFRNCTSLVGNSSFGDWDASGVINMAAMFRNAEAFDQDLGNWDVSNVEWMMGMFYDAESFDQDLGSWDISSLNTALLMFFNATLSTANYDALLMGWSTLDTDAGETEIPTNLYFDGGNSQYCLGEDARNLLIGTYDWEIDDSGLSCSAYDFVTRWETTSTNQTITLPITLGADSVTIDWGDGTALETVTTDDPTHTYGAIGSDYQVTVTGDLDAIAFNGIGDRLNILEVVQWGSTPWSTMANAFLGCENLDVTAMDTPNLSQTTSLNYMFAACNNLVGTSAFNNWDVSNISSMEGMFLAALAFDQPLNGWDVSNVTNLQSMFNEAHVFDQPLEGWDVSVVTNMRSVFKNALAFDQDLGSWDIGSATDMDDFLTGTSLSLENYDNTIIGFATLDTGEAQLPSVQDFDGGSNQVCFAVAERGILIGLTTGTYLDGGVNGQCSGDAFITQWELEGDALGFTLPIANGEGYYYEVDWGDSSPVETGLTGEATHDYGVTDGIGGTKTIAIRGVFPRIIFGLAPEQDRLKLTRVTQWGDIQWSSMKDAFLGCENLDVTATDAPDLSNVTDMEVMFRGCSSLIGTTAFNTWDVSNVTSMFRTFDEAHVFNQPLNDWDVSNVTNMEWMFSGANAFNQDIGSWDTGQVTDLSNMFNNATSFDQSLGAWDISNINEGGPFSGMRS